MALLNDPRSRPAPSPIFGAHQPLELTNLFDINNPASFERFADCR